MSEHNSARVTYKVGREPPYLTIEKAINFETEKLGRKPVPGTVTFEQGIDFMKVRQERRTVIKRAFNALAEAIIEEIERDE